MGAIAAAAEETGDAAAHLGEAQHGRKGRKQGPHRRGERRAKAMGAATLAAAGAWRGLAVGADQGGRRRAAREREACGMGLLEADLEGSDRRRRGSGDLDRRRLNQRGATM